MRSELQNLQKSIAASLKQAEGELFALRTIADLIKGSAEKEWKEISWDLKHGIYLARLKFVGGFDYLVIENTASEGLIWYLFPGYVTYSQDSLDHCEILN